MRTRLASALIGSAFVFGGCTSGNSAISPGSQGTNLGATTKLQLAVGTANYMGQTMLNTVVTFRKQDGSSAVGVSTPALTGPFTVPAGSGLAGNDAGTSSITGSPQSLDPKKAGSSTFGQTDGAFSYGFLPDNYNNTTGTAAFGVYTLPLYSDADPNFGTTGTLFTEQFYGGAPAYPNVNDGNHAPGFVGFPQGFTIFDLTPGVGPYNLSTVVAAANSATYTANAAATLTSLAALPVFPAPTFTEDGNGGGTVALAVPAGAIETIVYVLDTTTGHAYSLLTKNAGAVTLTLPPNLGTAIPGAAAVPTIPAGDAYQLVAVGFDYPAFEASPPSNVQQAPAIVGANGQADLTVSLPTAFAGYGTGKSGSRLTGSKRSSRTPR